MKAKNIILMIAAVALTACSNGAEEAGVSGNPSEIKFAAAGGSRAEDFMLSNLRQHGFVCSVKYNGAYLSSKVSANYDGELFRPAERLFWPAEVSDAKPCHTYAVSWEGIGDYPKESLADDCGFSLTTEPNAVDQIDVIVARAASSAVPADGVESLHFTHALTKVNFTVYVENNSVNAGYIWRVNSIKVNCINSGDYSFENAAAPWSIGTEAADHEYMKVGENFELLSGQNWVGNNSLMLIPQAGKKVTATVAWDVYKQIGSTLVKMSRATAKKTFVLATEGWHPGASLRYTNLRLPNVGEKTPGGGDGDGGDGSLGDDYDDNNMLEINYKGDVENF